MFPHAPVPTSVSLFPQDCLHPLYIPTFVERDSRQKNPAKKEKCSKSLKVTARRGMEGNDGLQVDQQQAEGQ